MNHDAIVTKAQRYRQVFNTPEGRWVLADILKQCQVFNAEAPLTAEWAAVRNMGLHIFHYATMASPEKITDHMINAAMDKALSITTSELKGAITKHHEGTEGDIYDASN